MSSRVFALTERTPLTRADLRAIWKCSDADATLLWSMLPKHKLPWRTGARAERVFWGDVEALLEQVPPDPKAIAALNRSLGGREPLGRAANERTVATGEACNPHRARSSRLR